MRRTAIVTVAAVAVLGAVGCGHRSGDNAASSSRGVKGAEGAGSAGGSLRDATSGGTTGGSGNTSTAKSARVGGAPAAVGSAPLARSVVRTAALTVKVDDVDDARTLAIDAAERAGGYLEAESSDEVTSTTLTLRVEPDSFATALGAVAKLGKVVTREVSTEDVTGDVADVEGRLKAARTSAARLRALLDRAGSVTEVASLESELSDRESDIESLAGRQRALAARVELATIRATLTKVVPPPPPKKVAATGFTGGLRGGWHAFTNTMRVILVIVGALLPFLALAALLGTPYALWRRRRRVADAAAHLG